MLRTPESPIYKRWSPWRVFWPLSTDQLLGVIPERAGPERDHLLGQIEASLAQIGDDDMEIISVEFEGSR